MPTAAQPVQDAVPPIDGMRYMRMLNELHASMRPDWYLEVGTFSGRSLALANCNYVAVDPSFRIQHPIVAAKARQMHLVQMTSDDFFASGFATRNGIAFDLAFLDGLHLFEYLLRDFIGTEKLMAPKGVITLHDCCPLTEKMALREFQREMWTGDVWKTLLILLKHRPDLRIEVARASPTGLVVISGLDPENTILETKYDALVAEYSAMTLDDLPGGIGGLYRHFELVDPEAVLQRLADRT